jgi:hypothetical protein
LNDDHLKPLLLILAVILAIKAAEVVRETLGSWTRTTRFCMLALAAGVPVALGLGALALLAHELGIIGS